MGVVLLCRKWGRSWSDVKKKTRKTLHFENDGRHKTCLSCVLVSHKRDVEYIELQNGEKGLIGEKERII